MQARAFFNLCEWNDERFNENFDLYKIRGKILYKKDIKTIGDILSSCISGDGVLNATEVRENLFPIVDADVFLSHSSKNRDLAFAVAGYLNSKRKNIKVFIDSALWGSMYSLEEELNNKYSYMGEYNNGPLYDYNKSLYIASHTRMLLATALSEMIGQTKNFVVLNTSESLDEDARTNSPWIYYELFQADQILKSNPQLICESYNVKTAQIKYDVNDYISKFKPIDLEELYRSLI